MRPRRSRRPLPRPFRSLIALAGLLALAACAQTSINLDRDGTLNEPDGELETISPYAFVDRFGEPDIWRNEGETRGGLTMTQIWNCTQGRYREITWRMVQRSQGGMSWTVVNDINRQGKDCGKAAADSTVDSGVDPTGAPADTSAAGPGATSTPPGSAGN